MRNAYISRRLFPYAAATELDSVSPPLYAREEKKKKIANGLKCLSETDISNSETGIVIKYYHA